MIRIVPRACLLLIAASAPVYTSTALADEPSTSSGTWQKHEYSFVSMGFTSTYSCDGLADQLKRLLLTAGARADVKAYPGACPSGFGRPDKLARADLVFYTLTPDSDGKPVDGTRTAGAWHAVALAPKSPRELGLGDCELVEQFRAQLLPMFAARDIVDRTTCIPHQESGSVIDLQFESFAAAAPRNAPGAPDKRP